MSYTQGPQHGIDLVWRRNKEPGVRYNPLGLIYDRALRPFVGPMDVLTHDPMHGLHGVASQELTYLLRALLVHFR